jgi:uncharacterized protein YukE
MTTGQIVYQTAAIADAAAQIHQAAAQTEQNHQQSLSIVTRNAEHFGGKGSAAFQQAIAAVNSAYAQSQQAIQAAGRALGVANVNMTETDGQMAAQYT